MTLFTDEFPLINRDDELQKLIEQFPDYDSYYVASGAIEDRRNFFEGLYAQYEPYADATFHSDKKKQFHQRSWEMYLSCVLLDNGFTLVPHKIGPDILIELDGRNLWIECIACEQGNGDDQVPDMPYGVATSVPTDQMLLRITNALGKKRDKYSEYLKKEIVNENDYLLIAINSGALRYPEGPYPLILRATYAVGHPTITFSPDTQETKSDVSTVSTIEKNNSEPIPMSFFMDEDNALISAAIYSNNLVINHPDTSGSGIRIVHNHLANSPLSEELLRIFQTHKIDEKGNLPLIMEDQQRSETDH